jgi:ribose 5-phosphate isomerase B
MRIAIGADHAGYRYKQEIIKMLEAEGHEVLDMGTAHPEVPDDYPDFIWPAACAVPEGKADRAIVLGGSGNGEALCANKVKGIRCILGWSEETATLGRRHNNANCLSIGERTIPLELALKLVKIFLTTEFEGGRHVQRIEKVATLEGLEHAI